MNTAKQLMKAFGLYKYSPINESFYEMMRTSKKYVAGKRPASENWSMARVYVEDEERVRKQQEMLRRQMLQYAPMGDDTGYVTLGREQR